MLAKYTQSSSGGVKVALLSNANIGGENVHRGAVLGAILGARAGVDSLPGDLVSGLYDRDALEEEIESFVNAVMQKSKDGDRTAVNEL